MTAPQPGNSPFRFCPRCGAEAFSQPDHRRRLCAACGFEHFINAASAVGAVIERGGEGVLFLERARDPGLGLLGLPGGFVDPGETAEEALRREVAEETGLELATFTYLISAVNRYSYGGVVYVTVDLFFRAEPVSWKTLANSEESRRLLFVPRPEIDLERIAFPSLKTAMAFYLRQTPPPCPTQSPR